MHTPGRICTSSYNDRRRAAAAASGLVLVVGSVADVHTDSESDVAESREGPESPDPSC